MLINKKDIKIVFGFGGLITCVISFYIFFFMAYMNGLLTGNFETTIFINNFHEAHIEAILFIIMSPFIFLYLKKLWKVLIKYE